jgi:hypothetical protein
MTLSELPQTLWLTGQSRPCVDGGNITNKCGTGTHCLRMDSLGEERVLLGGGQPTLLGFLLRKGRKQNRMDCRGSLRIVLQQEQSR